jgi:hypothetical protein
MSESPETQTTFGYLSALESPEHGFFGGYLVISPIGRPLEFHCTAPVVPSRAQRILYGASFASYLFGEQLAGTLLAAGKLTPGLILTDHVDFGLPRQNVPAPLALVQPARSQQSGTGTSGPRYDNRSASTKEFVEGGNAHPSWGNPFTVCDYLLQLSVGCESETNHVIELVSLLNRRVDLLEPFERIHEAIREAQRLGTRSQEAHGHAA